MASRPSRRPGRPRTRERRARSPAAPTCACSRATARSSRSAAGWRAGPRCRSRSTGRLEDAASPGARSSRRADWSAPTTSSSPRSPRAMPPRCGRSSGPVSSRSGAKRSSCNATVYPRKVPPRCPGIRRLRVARPPALDPPADANSRRIGLTRPRRAAVVLAAACGLAMAAGTAPALADSPLGAVAAIGRLRAQVGVARGIVVTADAGHTWRLERYTSHRVHEVQFPTARVGFALSRRGVLATTDGGAHWTHRGLRTTLAEVDFLGPKVGWGLAKTAAGLQVVRTSDGGRTWKERGEQARSVCFTTGAVGWIGKGRKVLFTDDGGATWQLQFTLAHTAGEAVVHCTRGGSVWALFTDGAATSHQA